ncbi:chemotaxis protein CheA [Sphingorhabdus buctiana]|uniref:histidine kinase n=1 Tax=Sphingorhabdus buctiana TaxID=1508805 RepID=A0ABW4MDE5_9SPHN
MDDLREEFIAETRETLEILAGQLVQWEKDPSDKSLIDSAFRFVHTVKGSCGFLDLPRLLRLSHAAEELLSHARDEQIVVSSDMVTPVLAVIDRISELTEALESGEPVFDNDATLIDAMLAFLPDKGTPAIPAAAIRQLHQDEPGEAIDEAASASKTRTVRVSLTLLDKLMNGISDLVLARNEVSRQLRRVGSDNEIDQAFGRLSSTVAEMRDAIGMMRMQHIDRLFSTLPRLLRDICIELGKQIELTVEGSEVEVDREMVEALRDPLTHILRNAADHGIEDPEQRRSVGKDPVGHIRVVARQSGNQILIEISDDGRGIDVEKLGQRAIARKLLTSSQWQNMPERAKLETIFAPGLSTAEAVTSISGRGVGMDVVRTNMHAIGGSIDLENYEGQGLKITLRLPLTLSIIAGLSLRAGGQIYGISRSAVVEIVSVSNRSVEIEEIGGMPVAKVRGERLAYAKLETILGVAEMEGSQSARSLVIIKPAVGATFALDVEAVVDNEELVVKPGAPLIMATGLYAGTSLPDNGKPMLLLDASGLAAEIGVEQDLFEMANRNQVTDAEQNKQDADSGLLFQTLDGTVQAIRLAVVDRIEDVDGSAFHQVGGRLCVSVEQVLYDAKGLKTLPDAGATVKMLRLSDGSTSVFLAVADVIDIFALDREIAPSLLPEVYEGIVHVDGKPVEVLNSYSFFEARPGENPIGISQRPLCFVDASCDDGWAQNILAPLLSASGYEVSFDPTDQSRAAVVLANGANTQKTVGDGRVVALRDSLQVKDEERGSIYRYDRLGLLSAIESKIAGAR